MNRKPDIQYVGQFYVPGSEARVLELKPKKVRKKTELPEVSPNETITVSIDLVAVFGLVVAVAMLLMLAVGVRQYEDACRLHEEMTNQVIALQNKNIALEQEYLAKIDMNEVREQAIALGMVPKEQAEVMKIKPVVVQPEPEMTFLEELRWYFAGWFE